MLFKRLSLKDFLIYEGSNSIDFPDPAKNVSTLLIVLAANNSGKTTFIKALKFLLYGDLLGESGSSALNLINAFAREKAEKGKEFRAWVEAEILWNGNTGETIRREISVYRRDDGSWSTPELKLGIVHHEPKGDRYNFDEGGALERRMQRIVPPALFDAYYFHGEPFGGRSALQDRQDTKVQEALSRLLHEDRWRDAKETVDKVVGVMRKDLEKLGAANKEYLKAVENLDQAEGFLKNHQSEIINQKALQAEIDEEFDEVQRMQAVHANEVEQLRKDVMSQQTLVSSSERLKRERREAERRLSSEIAQNCGVSFLRSAFPKAKGVLDEMERQNLLPGDYGEGFLNRLLKAEKCVCRRGLSPGKDDEAIESVEVYRQRTLEVDLNAALLKLLNKLDMNSHAGFDRIITETASNLGSAIEKRDEALSAMKEAEFELRDLDKRIKESSHLDVAELQHRLRRLSTQKASVAADISTREAAVKQITLRVTTLKSEVRDLERKGGVSSKVAQITEAIRIGRALSGLIEDSLTALKRSIHTFLQSRISKYYDEAVTDKSIAKINSRTLSPYVQSQTGEPLNNIGGGMEQLLKLSYIISLSELRAKLHERMHALGLGTLKLDDQSFFLDAPFSNTVGNYAQLIAIMLSGNTRQLVVFLF
jgi:hypothetical protein